VDNWAPVLSPPTLYVQMMGRALRPPKRCPCDNWQSTWDIA